MGGARRARPFGPAGAWAALALAVLSPSGAWAAMRDGPALELEALPRRLSSGQTVILVMRVSGLPGDSARAEVATVLADRAVGRRTLQVRLDRGRGKTEMPFTAPQVKERVPVPFVARVWSGGEVLTAMRDSEILPRWDSDRLGGALRNAVVGVVDPEGVVAAALGGAGAEQLGWGGPLDIRGYRGDLIICHLPDHSPLSAGLAEALLDQLRSGTAVLWLSASRGRAPTLAHRGELVDAHWPFALRPGVDLPLVLARDLESWAGSKAPLPLPLEATTASARLLVCSDRAVLQLEDEPAAGWLWEDLLTRALKPAPSARAIKGVTPLKGLQALRTAPESVVAVLDLRGDEWVAPDDPHLEWLRALAFLVGSGARVVITGAGADRFSALRALLGWAPDFTAIGGSPDVMLAPNLLLWGIVSRDRHEGLLSPAGRLARSLRGVPGGERRGIPVPGWVR